MKCACLGRLALSLTLDTSPYPSDRSNTIQHAVVNYFSPSSLFSSSLQASNWPFTSRPGQAVSDFSTIIRAHSHWLPDAQTGPSDQVSQSHLPPQTRNLARQYLPRISKQLQCNERRNSPMKTTREKHPNRGNYLSALLLSNAQTAQSSRAPANSTTGLSLIVFL